MRDEKITLEQMRERMASPYNWRTLFMSISADNQVVKKLRVACGCPCYRVHCLDRHASVDLLDRQPLVGLHYEGSDPEEALRIYNSL